MKTIILVLIFVACTGCASNNQGREDGFYTWVDSSGVVRTQERKPQSNAKASKPAKINKRSNDFDPNDFTPSDQIDDRLDGQKLYSWMENGRQQISEEAPQSANSESINSQEPKLKFSISRSRLSDSSPLKQGKIWQHPDVLGREIRLSQYYSYSDRLQRDYLLIDLYNLTARNLTIRTFAKDQALAFPHFIQLDNKLNIISEQEINWEGYNHESWSTYGYLKGSLQLAPQIAFLLVMTRTDAGAMEVDGKLIKLVDLGSIEISSND
ncbi:hypothetical protein HF888_08235 [Bermanella marisrubri]|uniref:DUF4124 domain-containing protein n=1 Tax=Bermanella marisrubri TaxID=207949 RepID=Q1MXZ5_9GAMM|nr:hypothetical protein [Bermanella marisrubri]EAT10834.1 hypothetical protein RED65_07074 [Oceanobacter sp. RED65] [Bermanella marisrubri]QIZ84216.1 hypothetical protein HF888_08235 [Bermanella marisrubri]